MINRLSVQRKSDFMPACASPSGFTAPYYFSISPTCDFPFGERVFM